MAPSPALGVPWMLWLAVLALALSGCATPVGIIAVKGDGPKEAGDDGVVAYQSAHIDEAVSEWVVRWDHSCQGQPDVIEEIRRILLEPATAFQGSHP